LDIAKARDAYRRAVDADPMAFGALNNTAVMAVNLGERETADSLFRRAIALGSATASTYTNLVGLQAGSGNVAAAESTYRAFSERFPAHAQVVTDGAHFQMYRRQYDSAEARLQKAMDDAKANAARREFIGPRYADVLMLRGRYREGDGVRNTVSAALAVRGEAVVPIRTVLRRANRRALLFGPTPEGRAIVDSLIRSGSIEQLPLQDRPYEGVALSAALLGDVATTARYAAMADKQLVGSDTTVRAFRHWNAVSVAMSRSDWSAALRELSAAELDVSQQQNVRAARAWLHDRAGHADSARVWWEKVARGATGGSYEWMTFMPLAWERLGVLYEAQGENEKAIQATEEFIRLWQKADPELQPRVGEARERLERLRRKVRR
jgi:tetratricopeptide (TPR) repeat protein